MDGSEEPQNEDPEIFGAISQTVLGILQLYGWTIVFAVIAVVYISSKLRPWLMQKSQQSEQDSYKKMDAGAIQDRLEAMEQARRRMQAKQDEEAKKFAERQKEREEEKRKQRLEDWTRYQEGKGYNSKTRKAPVDLPSTSTIKSKPKKSLKPDYSPLMGENSGAACFRPTRRGGPSGGGG